MNLKNSLLLAASAAVSLCCAAPQVLIQDNFVKKTDKWAEVRCFKPFSLITYTEKGALLSRNEKQPPIKGRLFDTAFAFKSKPLTLPAGAEWFEVKVATNTTKKGRINLSGFKDGLWSRVLWLDKAGKRMKEKDSYYSPKFRKDKITITQHREAIPAGAVSAVLEFGMDNPDLLKNESFTLAGLQLTVGTEKEIKALPDENIIPHAPILISVSPVKDPAAPVVFCIDDAAHADLETIRFYWDDKEITSAVTRKGSRFSWKPATPMTKGVHFLTAEVRDVRSPEVEKMDAVVYYGPVNTKNVMTIRDDGMPMLNGKPFFVLGIACLVKQGRNGMSYDNAFKEAKEAGMNYARHWSSYNAKWKDAKEYYAAARKYGIYISAAPTGLKNDVDVRRVAQGVADQIFEEPVIAWDIGDDTSMWVSPEEEAAKNRAVKAVDPTRITTQGDPVGRRGPSRYTPFVNFSDNFQPEIYPIGNNSRKKETPEMTAKMVPEVIHDMKSVAADQKRAKTPKNIWPLIQYFHYSKDSMSWDRMPTEAELRAMSYLAVIHRGHGIYWYRYAGYPKTANATRGYSDEQWNALKKLSLEMRGLYDVLCERIGKQTQTVKVLAGPAKDGLEYDSVNTLLKEYKGTKYMFVCNSAMKPVKASFTVPGIKTGKDRFGKKNLTLKNGTFEDTLEGYGTRVYELK